MQFNCRTLFHPSERRRLAEQNNQTHCTCLMSKSRSLTTAQLDRDNSSVGHFAARIVCQRNEGKVSGATKIETNVEGDPWSSLLVPTIARSNASMFISQLNSTKHTLSKNWTASQGEDETPFRSADVFLNAHVLVSAEHLTELIRQPNLDSPQQVRCWKHIFHQPGI